MTDSWNEQYREQYTDYIKSPEWRARRKQLFWKRGRSCERCKTSPRVLQVHHLTYERLGNERDNDLVILCIPCHKKADAIREKQVWQKRWMAWALKVHGKDWRKFKPSELERQFIKWLKTKK